MIITNKILWVSRVFLHLPSVKRHYNHYYNTLVLNAINLTVITEMSNVNIMFADFMHFVNFSIT